MLILLIVVAAVILLAVVLGFGSGWGGYGGPVIHRRIVYRRPARRVITEHRVVDNGLDPVDRPLYRP